ncbi:hypothetical protein TTHERM_00388310 (macronuclear) [Tetrahymena thermophila SB210]|uniref:Uncharacterized protein n=1 Tax=Tetrahymena thermophila (strain SB210) TaxID=312017 RepID=Q23RF8_TETTS|nr:hypothetical protein TTHERM_00388310 [Tetrahymena thermophila SB210]EAR99090.2 hypothetical protein TTHERM_00388310 [Tetrahymena thermophila SB210]|eukprot:XP_001019335.2 hypothetical protein TTHERM_00388310 [Tetrahymena thermophila SB210]
MEDQESQTQYVGPQSYLDILSVGTNVSIKKNKQTLLRMYERIHSNHESYKKTEANSENVNEVKILIRGIVEIIEGSNQFDCAELMRICIFMSNMILCVDSNYRDDFIANSKNIFQILGQYFVQLSDISSSSSENCANANSQNHEYQTLVFIYKLLMATRHPSETVCAPKKGSAASQNPADVLKEKDSIITMREKLISKDFMKKILEIDVEDFAPSENLVAEMWKMLLAFYTLFAKSKDKIAQFGLIRNAKDKFLEAIFRLHELSKSDTTTLLQAVGCLNYTLDKIKLSLKEIQKYNLVPVLCDLLENPRTITSQLHIILKMFLNLSKQNLLSKNSYQTMCLGKAFKVFERAPAHAAELIADIYKKDPVSLKDITLQSATALLRGLTQKWNYCQILKRSQQVHLLSHMNPQYIQVKRMLFEIEGQFKCLIPLISQMINLDVLKSLIPCGDAILYQLLNSVKAGSSPSSSDFDLSQSSSLSSHQCDNSDLSALQNLTKIEAEDLPEQNSTQLQECQ